MDAQRVLALSRLSGRAGRTRRIKRQVYVQPVRLARRFLRNVALWLVPVWAVWALVTPYSNRLLLAGTQSLLRLTERPRVTALYPHPASFHDAYIARLDFPPARQLVRPFRVTDAHFPLVLTAALFLGVPGVAWRERMRRLGGALLAGVLFELALLFLMVKAVYATGLGAWSLAHYGPLARNVYGLAWHLFDLPFKLALPFVLWTGFHFRLIASAT